MRRALGVAMLLSVTVAGTAVGAPAGSFGLYGCTCVTTAAVAPQGTALGFAARPPPPWGGHGDATNAPGAGIKAQRACAAERRGRLSDCRACRCER